MPQWLTEAKKRALAKDSDFNRRIDLIQDFEMPTATQCIRMTNDGEHIITTGTYAPSVRCYTLSDMAMKFQRGLTSEVVAFEPLSDDFGKLVFLQSDRSLNFHAPYGKLKAYTLGNIPYLRIKAHFFFTLSVILFVCRFVCIYLSICVYLFAYLYLFVS
jgi:hypothetical protein